ncbi:MAG: DUF2066 domain-containing protein [Gammaproteobacteria bacterium]|nr:MAG: DUF2066 domain-containing protein [Gammaproteobacteria bacterium]
MMICMKNLFLALILLVFLPITSAFAVKVSSLYEADIPVTAQSDDERDQAATAGLIEVLMKVSGDPEVGKNPVIKNAVKRASYYVQEYSYATPSASAAQYLLQIRYDKAGINNLLKKAGIAYWGESRPLILAWVASTNDKQAVEIIGSESPDTILGMMKDQGKKYGLPLIFPMMDVDDMNKVSPNDVSTMALPVLQAAGQRYMPDALLVGNIQPDGNNGFQSQWQLVLGEDHWDWQIAGKTTNDVVMNMLNQVSQTLAKHYVVKPTDAPQLWLKLEVANVIQRDDLAQLIQYLKQLAPVVQQVQLMQVNGSQVELSVLVRGSLTTFQEHASIGNHLQFKSQDGETNTLLYDWVH